MIAAELVNMRQGERTDLTPIGCAKSQSAAADVVNVSSRAIKRARHKNNPPTQNLFLARFLATGILGIKKGLHFHVSP